MTHYLAQSEIPVYRAGMKTNNLSWVTVTTGVIWLGALAASGVLGLLGLAVFFGKENAITQNVVFNAFILGQVTIFILAFAASSLLDKLKTDSYGPSGSVNRSRKSVDG